MSSVLLLSGGIDSISLAYELRPELCITIDYGQKAANAEVQSSKVVCEILGLKHITIKCELGSVGMGDMSNKACAKVSEHSEFWPFRNQFLVTIAAMTALSHGHETVLIGSVINDTRHRDGTEEFRNLFNDLLIAQEGSIQLKAPAAKLNTVELVESSGISLDILAWSHSCHTGNLACGTCNGCLKHSSVMRALGAVR
jgi:7-cyano-7-deazaguanine synthase